MLISKLRLSGFKSFGDPSEVRIEAGLTGIVGPNGCGKSNIIDAIRWVMGETSAKGLRGGEMEDVIFAGSQGRPAHDWAEVALSLEFDGPLPGGSGQDVGALEVVRRLSRGAGASYRMNGREARLRDVTRILADASAGARSAAIVTQGQIGALVDARPQERRRLLEDAAGIGGLHSRRHEAELKLNATLSTLALIDERLALLRQQAGSLEKQAKDAERFKAVAKDFRETQARLLLLRYKVAAERLAKAEAAEAEAKNELALREQRLAEAKTAAQSSAEVLELRQAAETAHQAELARLEERLRAKREQAERTELSVQQWHARSQDLARDLDRQTVIVEEAETAVNRLDVQLSAVQSEISTNQTEAEAVKQSLEAVGQALSVSEARLGEAREGLASARQELALAEAERARLIRELEAAEHAVGAITAELDGLAQDEMEHTPVSTEVLSEAREALAEATQKVNALGARMGELADQVARAERYLLACECHDLSRQLDQLTDELKSLDVGGKAACVETARTALGEAERSNHAAGAARAEAEVELRAAETALGQLRAEGEALDRALASAEVPTDAIAGQVKAPGDLAPAIASALGDDLLASIQGAGPKVWHHLPNEVTCALPEPAVALSTLIEAPAVLKARLSQTGLVDEALGAELQAALAPGQRLVSKAGTLWRWDGLVVRAGTPHQGNRTAAALLRLRQIEEEMAAAQERSEAAARVLAERGRAAEQQATILVSAKDQLEQAQKGLIGAEQRAQALMARRDHLNETRERALKTWAAAVGDGVPLPTRGNEQPDQARTKLADTKREHASIKQAWAEARELEAHCRQRLDQARAEHDRATEALGEARRAADERRHQLLASRSERERQIESWRTALDEIGERIETAIAAAQQAADGFARAEVDHGAARRRHDSSQDSVLATEARQAALLQQKTGLEEGLARWRERSQDGRAHLRELERRRIALAEEEKHLAAVPEDLLTEIDQLDELCRQARNDASRVVEERSLAEREARDAQGTLRQLETERTSWLERQSFASRDTETANATVEAADGTLKERLGRPGASLLADPSIDIELKGLDVDNMERRLGRLEAARERLGAVNLRADLELKEVRGQLDALAEERDELDKAVRRLRGAIAELNEEGKQRLRRAFAEVEQHFEGLFKQLFGGGRADLRLVEDPEDPLAAGLELSASPPGKRLQALSLLSGGEKALTAIALIFAFFKTQQSPLCVLDEVDAPLDDANVGRLSDLMETIARGTSTRFLVVTHHPLTMARMDRLYGVTMIERGLSQLVSVDLSRAVSMREEMRASA
ncbi:MAG: AAA family ATPase [Geminicoccaceae bacterium]